MSISAGVAAAGFRLNVPSGPTLLALAPLLLIVVGLIVYCLVDLARARSVRYLPKAVWALIIILGSAPFGAIAYLVLGRNRYDDRTGAAPPDGPRPRDDRTAV
jgi:hypothetical protein